MRCSTQRRRLVAALPVIPLLIARAVIASAETPTPDLISTLRHAKEDAEGLVLRTKQDLKPANPAFREAQKLYREAAKAYESYIGEVVLGLIADEARDFSAVARRADEAGQRFAKHVQATTKVRAGLPDLILPVFEALVKVAADWWGKYKAIELEKRRAIAQELQRQLTWDRWEDIKY